MENNHATKYKQEHDSKYQKVGFSTKCLHIGQEPDINTGAVNPPIQLSTTYAQHNPGEPFGPFDYSRCGNPTRDHLERLVAGIENGKHALIWASGMAATTGILHLLKSGEELLCIDGVYGGTQRYFNKISGVTHGVKYTYIPMDNMEVLKKSLNENTKMIWFESPTNPTLKVTDIRKVVETVRSFKEDILIVVDNTFMSPYNCRPLELGVDIVVESATKYLGGHSDVVMGVCAMNSKEIYDKLYFIHKSIGAVPSPFDCYMTIRGIKTLSIRVERQNYNALEIAKQCGNLYDKFVGFVDDLENGAKEFTALREKGESHQIEKVGRELRKMFSWMKKNDNDDYKEGSAARG